MEKGENYKITCRNCRYYYQHCTKLGKQYNTVFYGHCLRKYLKSTVKQPFTLCEYWEDINTKKELHKHDLEEAISVMSERLDKLIMILNEEVE